MLGRSVTAFAGLDGAVEQIEIVAIDPLDMPVETQPTGVRYSPCP